MTDKTEIKQEKSNSCVVNDDTHGWGGDANYISYNDQEDITKDADELINQLIKQFPEIHIDEPMNWPFR